MRKYWRNRYFRIAVWIFFILPAVSAIIANLGLLAYLYWPKRFDAIAFDQFVTGQARAMVVVHGSGDTPASWASPLLEVMAQKHYVGALYSLDWHDYAANPLRCSIDGTRIGRRLGQQLASNPSLQAVHFIAHSCGAFVILNACRTMKAVRPELRVQTTYLDPVSIYGPWMRYGVSRFGSCADYSDAYIDIDDQVAGSNELLPNTHTYDVTSARVRRKLTVNPHVWPTLYYLELARSGAIPDILENTQLYIQKPRGELEKLD